MTANAKAALALAAGAILIAVASVVAYLGYEHYVERYTIAREDDGTTITRIVAASFANASTIKVGQVSGTVQSTASDTRYGIFTSDKVIKAPFTVDYFVDVSGLKQRDYHWDAATRTLTVDVPPVTVSKPNIDAAAMSVSRTRGLLVTRDAADALARRTALNARTAAQAEARKPEHIAVARENARRALRNLMGGPLAAAGIRGAVVSVRFPDERPGSTQQWDMSRSIPDVLANSR